MDPTPSMENTEVTVMLPRTGPANPSTPRTPSRWAALAVLCAGTLMTILDGNIVTVAMPAIQGTSASPLPGSPGS